MRTRDRSAVRLWGWLATGAIIGAWPALPASAQSQADGDVSISVLTPLSFVNTADLSFGNVFAATTTQSVTIDPVSSNATTTSPNLRVIGNDHHRARFGGFGSPGQSVLISIGANQIFITGPGTRMRVNNFRIGSSPTAPLSTNPARFVISSPSGAFEFGVGATLRVNGNQAPGFYQGQFTVILAYE